MLNNEKLLVASMRGIAMDSINQAKGGHLGMALGAANITYSLIGKAMNISQADPKWMNRDRFVLSAGHGSMAFYSIMHFMGLLTKDDMKEHKVLYSKTPGHPEHDKFAYVEASTGPLGQGVAMGVGMAVSQKYLATRYNKEKFNVFDHYVYVLTGDGCLQEGVSSEAIQFAGTNKLDRFILIHDFNNAQIDSKTDEVNNINLINYFKACGFATFEVKEDEPKNIIEAINEAKASGKPSYIQVHTKIAPYTPFENTPKGHHGVLNEEQTIEFKKAMGLDKIKPFEYDSKAYDYAKSLWTPKDKTYENWNDLYAKYAKVYPKEAKELEALKNQSTIYDFNDIEIEKGNSATRNYNAPIMKKIEAQYPFILGGSADLASSTKIDFVKKLKDGGQGIRYGIREFAMSAMNNGIYLDSNLKTIDSTFLVFADYAKPALRLGAMMMIPSIHVYTHDSYQVGGDGPTHQPVEQLAMLRSIPNMKVIRPCDESETKAAYTYALNQESNQISIIQCRQNIKSFNKIKSFKAAYPIYKPRVYDLSILASGSEVELAMKVKDKLLAKNITAQVISVPLLQDLLEDEKLIKSLKITNKPLYAIEASSDCMWYKLSQYSTKMKIHLAEGFGESADGKQVYSELKHFDAEYISNDIENWLVK